MESPKRKYEESHSDPVYFEYNGKKYEVKFSLGTKHPTSVSIKNRRKKK
jgi:hypothetical protein